jgi:NAD(P)-dependent dehydrogenase (short-subunit alcohol dehydrogenase family)
VRSDPELRGARVVVTGASRGIGSVVCRDLARRGASLALVGRDLSLLHTVADDLAGGPHSVIVLDVADEARWDAAREEIAPAGVVHGLVTAAGELGPIGPIGSWTVAAFRRTLDVNVVGTLLAISTLLEPLRAAEGAVVTFSGGGGTSPLPRYDAYATSKAAVVRLTENLAVDLSEHGVRINCVAPGFVVTDIHAATIQAGPGLAGAGYFERTRRAVETGGDPPELAAALVAFLLSRQAAGITGRLISARWDPWAEDSFRERLRRQEDLATLRRIDDQFFTVSDAGKK